MFYTQSQWLLFFFLYCFLGWLWESCFVSVRKGEWVNRGFLKGPILPIYGFGAIAVLWLTLPVQSNLMLVYLLGMAGATALEYITGAVMEKILHVRYWDYSGHRFNLNGYICLECSLGWGAFSILLIKLIHPPMEHLILQIPPAAADLCSLALVIVFVADTTRAVQSAMDLKSLLNRIDELQDLKAQMHRIEEELELRRDRRYEKILQILRRNPGAVSLRFQESFGELTKMAVQRKKLRKKLRKEKHEEKRRAS